MEDNDNSKSRFLVKNLIRGIIWFLLIIVVYVLVEDFLQENFKHSIEDIQDRPLILFSVFFVSEVFFGVVPPEFFMLFWVLHKVTVSTYVVNLSVLTVLSFISGVIGYFVGRNFRKTMVYRKIRARFLRTYELQLRRYGGYLVFVGAVTPVPFSATCMLAGSVEFDFKDFILICLTRILRFAVYGWMVWSFPNWFS